MESWKLRRTTKHNQGKGCDTKNAAFWVIFMVWKGFTKVSISKITDKRLLKIKRMMVKIEPDKYPEEDCISYNDVISWMIDQTNKTLNVTKM